MKTLNDTVKEQLAEYEKNYGLKDASPMSQMIQKEIKDFLAASMRKAVEAHWEELGMASSKPSSEDSPIIRLLDRYHATFMASEEHDDDKCQKYCSMYNPGFHRVSCTCSCHAKQQVEGYDDGGKNDIPTRVSGFVDDKGVTHITSVQQEGGEKHDNEYCRFIAFDQPGLCENRPHCPCQCHVKYRECDNDFCGRGNNCLNDPDDGQPPCPCSCHKGHTESAEGTWKPCNQPDPLCLNCGKPEDKHLDGRCHQSSPSA